MQILNAQLKTEKYVRQTEHRKKKIVSSMQASSYPICQKHLPIAFYDVNPTFLEKGKEEVVLAVGEHAPSVGRFRDRAFHVVTARSARSGKRTASINPYRNQYLDKCYGESKTSLGEWMYFSTDEENYQTGRLKRACR